MTIPFHWVVEGRKEEVLGRDKHMHRHNSAEHVYEISAIT